MTRLNRTMWREQRAAEATTALQVFLYAREIGESDIAEEAQKELRDLVTRIRDSLEATTLEGIYHHDNFMDTIGGMDVLELFRFGKGHFMMLLDVLQISDVIAINWWDQ